jgi:hypothetical protein
MNTRRRFTKSHPCPICGGHDGLGRGQGVRCFGYYDDSGEYARCTREEHAGHLFQNNDGTYSHRLTGDCRCGLTHGDVSLSPHAARPAGLGRRAAQRFRSYFTLTAFLRRLHGDDTEIRSWIYRDARANEAFRVLRLDYLSSDGIQVKTYYPCHMADDGRWLLTRPALPLPLYNLPAILSAPPNAMVTVLEGEKCADIARDLGLPYVTTSAHGAKAPQLTDWSPLAGRSIAVIRDAGDDGGNYAEKVSALLSGLPTPVSVRVVSLQGLSDGEDIEQWAAARRDCGLSNDDILAELSALMGNAFLAPANPIPFSFR